MNEPPKFPPLKPLEEMTPGERSAARDSAFSKPGTTKASPSKGWKPAHGTRFRATAEKRVGRPRIRKPDPRVVKFY